MNNNIAQKIKRFREINLFSQEFVADHLNISRPTYILIEQGKREINYNEMLKLSELFGVQPDFLFKELSSTSSNSTSINFNKHKYKSIILFILNQIGAKPNIGLTVFYKLLFYIDYYWYSKNHTVLTTASYIKNYYGPTPKEFFKTIKEMVEEKIILEINSKYFEKEQKRFLPLKANTDNDLSEDERSHINKVLKDLSDKTASELTKMSHSEKFWNTLKFGEELNFAKINY